MGDIPEEIGKESLEMESSMNGGEKKEKSLLPPETNKPTKQKLNRQHHEQGYKAALGQTSRRLFGHGN